MLRNEASQKTEQVFFEPGIFSLFIFIGVALLYICSLLSNAPYQSLFFSNRLIFLSNKNT
jgi:hypothetical protein